MTTTTRRIPRPRPAVQPERHLHSPLGAQRERAVPCWCGTATFNVCARCDQHCTCADRSPLHQAIADEIRRATRATLVTHSRTYLLIRTAVRAVVLIAIYAVVCLDSPVLH